MSHPVNDQLMEQYFEEGCEIGEDKGLEGRALYEFAEQYAENKFWQEAY
jgi:hypothetical protein